LRGALLRFGYIYAILLVALPMVLLFVFMNPIYWWWFDEFRRPGVEREFGFQSDIREVALSSGDRSRRLIITQVVPGGRFDRAGVKPGDVVACLYHGDPDFWSRLLIALEGYETEIRLLSSSDLAKGCEAARRIRFEGRAIIGRCEPQNKGMKLTRPERIGALQLIPGVRLAVA
jgi:hypothetical protein